jgi:TP901 family phage tail tape measure protein
MDEFLILLQAKLDEAKSKGNVNADIEKLQNQLDKLKVQVEINPKATQKLADDIGKLINQKITISNIGIDTKAGIKAGQEYGKQVSQGISQGISSASKSTEKVLRDFSELNDAKRKFVDGHDLISKDDIADAERLYDTVRKAFSEFGQVTVSKGSMNDGSLENMRVKIEQVNGEMKITRDFMLYFNESKNGFKLVDDDTIRTTEKMVQHLNEEKNIINATNEEANAIKAKLAEQEKYYKNIKNEVNNLYSLKTKLLSADELQTAELEKQIKQTKERISYNNKQIDKKDLRDNSLDRQINDLEVAKQKQLDLASAKSQDVVNTKEIAQAEREAIVALKERQAIEAQVNQIQLSMTDKSAPKDNYDLQIKKLTDQLSNLGLTNEEVAQKTRVLTEAQAELKKVIDSTNYNSINEKNQAILSADEKRSTALNQVKNAYEDAKLAYDKYMQPVSSEKATSLINKINSFLTKNTKITNDAKVALQGYIDELGRGVNLSRWNEINGVLKKTENSMRGLGRLGASLKDQMSQAAQSFTQWLSVSSVVMLGVSKTKEAISELIELDSILTEISKTSDLTNQQLRELGNTAFDSASKYGRSAADYLTGVQEMYRAGFKNAEEMAELSLLAQAAGDMESNSANDYLMATNAAYNYKGSVEELNKVLDSQNYITNNAAVSMQDMADATSEAASIAAQYGVEIDELSALIAVATSKTRESGSEVGIALKSIFVTLQDTTSKPVVEAFDAVGISMTKIVNGSEQLKTPIELLKELSVAFNELQEGDTKRANILTDIGKKYHANTLSAILSDWESYESMLELYSQGIGSAADEAEKSANNIEGSLNRLSNTWTDTIENILNSDVILTVVKALNGLLSVINNVTDKLGSLGTIGLGAGLFAGVKNTGKCRISVRIS